MKQYVQEPLEVLREQITAHRGLLTSIRYLHGGLIGRWLHECERWLGGVDVVSVRKVKKTRKEKKP